MEEGAVETLMPNPKILIVSLRLGFRIVWSATDLLLNCGDFSVQEYIVYIVEFSHVNSRKRSSGLKQST